MASDRYLKSILTVIAAALVYLAIMHTIDLRVVRAEVPMQSIPTISDSHNQLAVPVIIYGASKNGPFWTFTPKQ